MYLKEKKDTNNVKTKHIIFYSLCVLYVLSLGTVIVDMIDFLVSNGSVHNSNNPFFTFSVVQLLADSAVFPLYLILTTLVACCDFISQFILVRMDHTQAYPFLIRANCQDLPLLDCVGLQCSSCDHSFNLSIRILRPVNLSYLTGLFLLTIILQLSL